MGKMEISDAERKRRSDLAKQLHKEKKIGGKQEGAGRPSKRAQAQVAEAVREDAPKIIKALRAALASDSPSTKLKAALAMLQIEHDEEDHKSKQEQRKYDRMDKEAMILLARQRLAILAKKGIDLNSIEAEAVDISDQKLLDE